MGPDFAVPGLQLLDDRPLFLGKAFRVLAPLSFLLGLVGPAR